MANPQVPVSYKFDLTVAPTDLEGNPVPDALTWADSDTTGATTIVVDDATTLKATVSVPGPGTPAGVVITASDTLGNTVTYDFDVVADLPTKLAVSASTPVKIA